jgi:hypothetical protein
MEICEPGLVGKTALGEPSRSAEFREKIFFNQSGKRSHKEVEKGWS